MWQRSWVFGLSLVCGMAWAQDATMVLYQVMEPGFEPYSSRLIVTPRYMRMDDGDVASNFVLFDRQKNIIYSVTHGDRTVLEIHPQAVTVESPVALERKHVQVVTEEDLPAIAGRTPHQYRLSVNGELCYETVAVDGLLPDVVQALTAFRSVLAGENARILVDVPADMHDPCDLALNTYAPAWQLQFGLPVQEHDPQGKGQLLMDFSTEYPAEAGLFMLPKGYQHYSPGR
ncbi:hypothetical protein [Sulfurivermis fontis]|jgi:hypothetical protein|uniref:hypothetical protein n=1 Tax=Sulfurivermis fontis TaxID=1972068 RepID=UPI000FD7AA2F|nr:hypothetical protein [Sulfurivermis fontis]